MTTEKLTGEITRKSKTHKFYILTVDNKQLSIKISFDQLPDNYYFIDGDIIEFEANLSNETPQFSRTIRKLTNKFFEELKLAYSSSETIQAFVYGQNSGAYEISYKGYKCFLPFSETVFKGDPFSISSEILNKEIDFQVKSILDRQVILTRVEIDKQTKLLSKQTEINSLYPGYSFFGTVKQVNDFGLFLTLRHSSGLLHLSDILGIDTKVAKKIKTDFYKLAKAVFEIDEHLLVTVKEINEQKYSLTWDKDNIFNKPFWDNITLLLDNDEQFKKIKERLD